MATKRLSVGASKSGASAQPDDTRQLMRQNVLQKKITGAKRVEHPLARYNKLDQLSCAICLLPVKNEASWNAHLLSKSHKENVEKFKRGEQIVAPVAPKAAAPASSIVQQYGDDSGEEMDHDEGSNESDKASEPPTKMTKTASSDLPADFFDAGAAPEASSALPADFFDSGVAAPAPAPTKPAPAVSNKRRHEETTTLATASEAAEAQSGSQLPEGFFDDAKMDAKARKVKNVDKFEDEWQDFQKEIAKETQVSRAIVDEEEDKLFIARDVDEIDEEIERWGRVEALHNKREAIKAAMASKMDVSGGSASKKGASDDEASGNEDFSLEDTLNWRKKKF